MNRNSQLFLAVVAMAMMLITLFTNWVVIRNAKISSSDPIMNLVYKDRTQTFYITGLNGSVSTSYMPTVPIWLVIAAGMLSLVIMSTNAIRITSLPKAAVALPLLFSAFYTAASIYTAVTHSDAAIQTGSLMMMAAIGIAIFLFFSKERRITANRSVFLR